MRPGAVSRRPIPRQHPSRRRPEQHHHLLDAAAAGSEVYFLSLSSDTKQERPPSVRNTFAAKYFHGCQPQYADVEPQRPAAQVFGIQRDFFGNWQLVAAVDLRPAREPRHQCVYALRGAQGDQVSLVEQGRPGPARNSCRRPGCSRAAAIHRGCSGAGKARSALNALPGWPANVWPRRAGPPHAPELGHPEDLVAAADTVGPVEGRAGRCQANERRHRQDGQGQDTKPEVWQTPGQTLASRKNIQKKFCTKPFSDECLSPVSGAFGR